MLNEYKRAIFNVSVVCAHHYGSVARYADAVWYGFAMCECGVEVIVVRVIHVPGG